MTLRWDVLAAILGMVAATFLCRAGGYAILRVTRPPPFIQAMLQHLPGAIFVAFLAPALVQGGWPSCLAGGTALLVQARLGRMAVSILAGVATLWLIRSLQ